MTCDDANHDAFVTSFQLLSELADADAIYGYSFLVTNLEVSTPDKAAGVEHWYRHRTQVENIWVRLF